MTDAARRLGLIVCLLVLLVLPAAAQQPVPALTGRVVDQAGILSPATETALAELLEAHEAETSNQLAVLTVTSLLGEPIESFSLRVAETWALGTAENDNGVLLTVAVEDRELRIEVGDGLESTLTDAAASRIIRHEIVPEFRAGDFEGGITAGVYAILDTIAGTYEPPAGAATEVDGWLERAHLIGYGVAMLLFALLYIQVVAGFAKFGVRLASGFFLIFQFVVFGFVMVGFPDAWPLLPILTVEALLMALLGELPYFDGLQKKAEAARRAGKKLRWGPFNIGRGARSSSGGSSFGGGSSGGGSSFSGGGGSFSGGGSSGSW